MFTLKKNYETERRLPKCDCIRNSPAEVSTISTSKSQKYINMTGEVSVISLIITNVALNFEVIEKPGKPIYADGKDIRLFNLGPIALFSSYRLTTSSAKFLENISNVHNVSLIFKLITSARGIDDLSIGFDRDHRRRQQDLTENNNLNCKYYVRVKLKNVFGFAEQHEKATFGLGFKLILTANKDDAVLNKAPEFYDARIKNDNIQWFVLLYTPSIPQPSILSKQNFSRTPTLLRCIGFVHNFVHNFFPSSVSMIFEFLLKL